MPLFGELDLAALETHLPRMPNLDTEAWDLPRAEIFQLAFETGGERHAAAQGDASGDPALRPDPHQSVDVMKRLASRSTWWHILPHKS